jgi:hypothetical protein
MVGCSTAWGAHDGPFVPVYVCEVCSLSRKVQCPGVFSVGRCTVKVPASLLLPPMQCPAGCTYIHDGHTYSHVQAMYMHTVCKGVLTFPLAMLAGPLQAWSNGYLVCGCCGVSRNLGLYVCAALACMYHVSVHGSNRSRFEYCRWRPDWGVWCWQRDTLLHHGTAIRYCATVWLPCKECRDKGTVLRPTTTLCPVLCSFLSCLLLFAHLQPLFSCLLPCSCPVAAAVPITLYTPTAYSITHRFV